MGFGQLQYEGDLLVRQALAYKLIVGLSLSKRDRKFLFPQNRVPRRIREDDGTQAEIMLPSMSTFAGEPSLLTVSGSLVGERLAPSREEHYEAQVAANEVMCVS